MRSWRIRDSKIVGFASFGRLEKFGTRGSHGFVPLTRDPVPQLFEAGSRSGESRSSAWFQAPRSCTREASVHSSVLQKMLSKPGEI